MGCPMGFCMMASLVTTLMALMTVDTSRFFPLSTAGSVVLQHIVNEGAYTIGEPSKVGFRKLFDETPVMEPEEPWSAETPRPSGPRHCGQCWAVTGAAVASNGTTASAISRGVMSASSVSIAEEPGRYLTAGFDASLIGASF